MPIEKLDLESLDVRTEHERGIMLTVHTDKLNELIDFINTSEKDRSEQMDRIIDKQTKHEKLQNERHQMMVNALAQHYQDKVELEKRISALENVTQPEERCKDCGNTLDEPCVPKESELLNCPYCGTKPESSVLVCLPPIYQIKCGSYICQNKSGFHGSTPQEAIAAWNKRHEK